MKTVLTILALCIMHQFSCMALERFAALSMIESTNCDECIGPDGEFSRWQITLAAWNETLARWPAFKNASRTNVNDCRLIAWLTMSDRVSGFVQNHQRAPTDFEWYLLWHRPARVEHPYPREAERARRFSNLCQSVKSVSGKNE